MKKMKMAMILLAGALALFAICGGGALASGEPSEWFYAGDRMTKAEISADFDRGLTLHLQDLRGYSQIRVELDGGHPVTLGMDADLGECEIWIDAAQLKRFDLRTEMTLTGVLSDGERVLWRGALVHDAANADAEARFRMMALDPFALGDAILRGQVYPGAEIRVSFAGDKEDNLGLGVAGQDGRFEVRLGDAELQYDDELMFAIDFKDDQPSQYMQYVFSEGEGLHENQSMGSAADGFDFQFNDNPAEQQSILADAALSQDALAADPAPIAVIAGGEDLLATQNSDSLLIRGTGAPSETILYRVNDGEMGELAQVGDDGQWSADLLAVALENAEDGEHAIKLFYPDAEDAAEILRVTVDRACSLKVNPYEKGDRQISGVADPKAAVRLVEGKNPREKKANAGKNGEFIFDLSQPLDSGAMLVLTAADGNGNTETVEISIPFKIAIDAEAAKRGLICGDAMTGYAVELLVNGHVEETTTAAGDRFSFSVKEESLPHGTNVFQVRYAEARYAEYISEAVEMENDIMPPQMTLDQAVIYPFTAQLTGTVNEPAIVYVQTPSSVNTESVLGSFAIPIDPQPEGTEVTIWAMDEKQHASQRFTLRVSPETRYLASLDLQDGHRHCYADPLKVSGEVIYSAELEGLRVVIGDVERSVAALHQAALTEDEIALMNGSMQNPQKVRFECLLDVSDLPLGEARIALQTAEGEEIPVGVAQIQLVKSGTYLPKRVFALLALLAGFAGCGIAVLYTSKRIRELRDAADDQDAAAEE